ncbi:hypothetical protein QTN89_26590 [Roseiconus lacunae]|uniref:Transposase n=1 Tax=Roseiconus lacunae TaxID=2605694 RepID=A0ABT7PRB6_9BACT|nr:hypothetical protein [Roseiconus lacunae]MDM4019050.1 hypothetical protein [Roseiconus lacunae]
MTIAEFCELEGYSTASFYQWRRKLREISRVEGRTFMPVDHACTVVASRSQPSTEIALS